MMCARMPSMPGLSPLLKRLMHEDSSSFMIVAFKGALCQSGVDMPGAVVNWQGPGCHPSPEGLKSAHQFIGQASL